MIVIPFTFFIIALIFILWAFRVRQLSNNHKLIRLFPVWVGLYAACLGGMFWVATQGGYGVPKNILIGLMCACVVLALMMILTFIVALVNKQYKNAIHIGTIGILIFFMSCIWSVFVGMANGAFDHFGRSHPIPADMQYLEPADCSNGYRLEQRIDSLTIERGILLLDDAQWGMYKYQACVPPMSDSGYIYLKLYEATTDFPLSEGNIQYNTRLDISPSDSAIIYKMRDDRPEVFGRSHGHYFTIYEGSWGDYYAARVELWFQPVDETKEPQLLMTRIYKVQGWSR